MFLCDYLDFGLVCGWYLVDCVELLVGFWWCCLVVSLLCLVALVGFVVV